MPSLLEQVLLELDSKAAYLCSLYRSHANARKGNYQVQINKLREQIELMQLKIEVLEEKQREFENPEEVLKKARRVNNEIKVLNIIAEMAGSPVPNSCTILRNGKYRIFRGYLKGKARGVKSITPTKKPMSLTKLLDWCRSNLEAMKADDANRLQILIDEYAEK